MSQETKFTKEYVIRLMKSSSSSDGSWNENAKKVKKAYGGKYPEFWGKEIIQGVLNGK